MSRARTFQSRETVLQEIRRGGLCAILVEGEEQGGDAGLLKYILRDVTTEVSFFGRDGRSRVLDELQEMIGQLPVERLFAVVDRDFESGEAVEQGFHPDYRGHIFFWRRFTLENYLLEPAWIVEAVNEFYLHEPDRIPATLRATSAVEQFLLDWAKRLTSQVAGNATIANLAEETRKRGLQAEAWPYFEEMFERDPGFVRSRLIAHYSAWATLSPDLFSAEAVTQRYDESLTVLQNAVQGLVRAHEFVSGKLLLKALYHDLPGGQKPPLDYLRNKLAVMASKSVPADMRTLVIDRILPRWRHTREGRA